MRDETTTQPSPCVGFSGLVVGSMRSRILFIHAYYLHVYPFIVSYPYWNHNVGDMELARYNGGIAQGD